MQPDSCELVRALRAQGLDKRAAARMSEEWLAHLEDLAADSTASHASARRQEALLRLGDPELLVMYAAQLPICTQTREVRAGTAVAVTWGGACAAGLLATASLFGAMTAAIGL
ncbi:MAG: hypothetical protein AAFN07_07970 [Pseudomonadota bacterium]